MKILKTHKTFGGVTEFLEHDSKVTASVMKFSWFLPSTPPKGCIIWLSGLTCTDENFITKAGAQRYLEEHQLMVVCPDTSPRGFNLPDEHSAYDFGSGASFYVDATTPGYRDHYQMSSYVTHELYDLIAERFEFGNRFAISGHSMGGHGALTLGLKNPTRFRSISAFAPIANPTAVPWGEKAFRGYLGDDKKAWESYDATLLLKAGKKHAKPILIDQGSGDEFMEKQLMPHRFAEAAKASGQGLELRIQEGYDHSYYFMASFIGEHIAFHAKHLS